METIMLKIPLFALLALCVLPGSTASAAEWSGVYAGLSTGYGSGRDSVSEINGPRAYQADPEGFQGGVHVGWLRQFDRFVGGFEVEGGYLGQSGETARQDAGGTVRSSTDIGAYGLLSGRAGVLVHPDWLVFGTAGVTLASLDATTTQSCTGSPCGVTPGSASTRDRTWGFTFGGGVERAVSERWRGRIEYRYTDFRRELALPAAGTGWNHDLDNHALRLSIERRF
jgi:outer membrane immunogenic protein